MSPAGIVLALIEINAIVVIVILILEERDPADTLAWAFALLLAPGIGLVAYLLFGVDHRPLARRDRSRREAIERGRAAMEPLYALFAGEAARELPRLAPLISRLSNAIERQCGTRLLPCRDLELFTSGAGKFERLLADIRDARQSIHLQYFIWEDDALTARFCDALGAKAAEGVEVRVSYDRIGSLRYGKRQLRALAASGVTVCTDPLRLLWLNYRDHRKIAVIDGRIGYTGGMNMGQEYADGGSRFGDWRDTHCRFTGALVAELQRMFAVRWYRLNREDLFGERYFPAPEPAGEGCVWAQVAYSGPETEWHAVRNAFLLCILGADRSLRIQSPYFVPDAAVMDALAVQSLTGIEVTMMMTGTPDKRTAWYAAFTYIDELVHAGGRMLQYAAGFLHAKTLTVDGELAVIGTTNFDIRSFDLHEELSVFFYDRGVARALDDAFEGDAARCREIDRPFFDRRGWAAHLRDAFFRLWSRLL